VRHIPRATYRLQLSPSFTFDDVVNVIDYLTKLGISHLYASPYLQAVSGSTHGYDVVDPHHVNEELGGAAGHRRMCEALDHHGLGQILDVVPNHMAISGPENVWWWDVLENGPSSQYASYFDVDWENPDTRLSNKVLMPVLGDHYGRILESGQIVLRRDNSDFRICYFEHTLPVAPRSLGSLLGRAAKAVPSEDLAFIADSLRQLPLPTATDRDSTRRRHRNKEVLREQLQNLLSSQPEIEAAVDAEVDRINGDPDALDVLLEEQNYRLAYWHTARHDLVYRRFFDINSLVALQVEDEVVFHDTHRLILEWLAEGTLDGVRIDHPDGLRDPEQYMKRLRQHAPEAWIVVEKVLHPGEELRATWPVQGTTGYEFMNTVGGLFVDSGSERRLNSLYRRFTAQSRDYRSLVIDKKLLVIKEMFISELNRLTELFIHICERHRRYRDYSRDEIQEALSIVIACFPVYRSYVRVDAKAISDEDRAVINAAVEEAQRVRQDIDSDLLTFLRDLLLLAYDGNTETELVMRFQQVTGSVTAKGVEDTAYYCFNRFVALNEVGGDPGRFGCPREEFHQAMLRAQHVRPYSMLSTSTHDTKRSEDVRARLAVLSEIPDRWSQTVKQWSEHNEQYRRNRMPDRNTEYLYYQNLVGAWPLSTERMTQYMEKAVREAKRHTSWRRPDSGYEKQVRSFVEQTMSDGWFTEDVTGFVNTILPAGRTNALSQVLIKLTAPGVPDFYQGTELWSLSLVDPDNRRPVDFEKRKALLSEVKGLSVQEVMGRMDEGLPKLWLIYRVLQLRKSRPELFDESAVYRPLETSGHRARHAVGYLRGESLIAVVPRFVYELQGDWKDTAVDIPAGSWHNELTDDMVEGGRVPAGSLFSAFPVALFTVFT
jgi:(1->4)-alpha-D-glucan 1-alpha-D-glucosylmutase